MDYNKEQTSIIECREKYQQVIAAAGSGKTSTMVALLERILDEKTEDPRSILVITFSRKAANEIRERLQIRVGEVELKIKTFHAYCLYAIQKFHPEYVSSTIKIIEDEEKEELFKEYFKREKFKVGGIPYKFLLEENFSLKKEFPEIYNDLEIEYKKYKALTKKLDFKDLIEIFVTGLRQNSDWTNNAKSEIQRIIVDEFQDTDMEQLEMIKLMDPSSLTVVGDDWQAIYGFRGASTIPFLKFKEFFSPCKVHFLERNYRSLSKIIQTSAIPISKNSMNIKKIVKPKREGKGFVGKILIETNSELAILTQKIQAIPDYKNKIKILCRSNFRISTYHQTNLDENCLMTIHKSKGLEFETVFVDLFSGWNLKIDEPKDTIEEERRILYVALSRAKNNLIILGNKIKSNDRIEDLFFSYFKRMKTLNLDCLPNVF
ncbi:MAG: UvrD-helicase domain-containing protein [Leptospiraceae bacterium]|nr:UvrD-helicase domain-containing protein [Leptospiraceae bacterium]